MPARRRASATRDPRMAPASTPGETDVDGAGAEDEIGAELAVGVGVEVEGVVEEGVEIVKPGMLSGLFSALMSHMSML